MRSQHKIVKLGWVLSRNFHFRKLCLLENAISLSHDIKWERIWRSLWDHLEYLNLVKVEGKQGQSSRYERMFTSLITFVWSYISSSIPGRSFRPATIRSILSELVHLFPTNTTFISILGAHESRSKVENHLRLTMDTVFFKSKDLIEVGERNWLYAIYVELNLNGDRFNQYSVRNLFEKAVEKER